MIDVILYTRKDCRLCEQAREDLQELQEEFPHQLIVVDVESDQKLRERYGFDVPVVKIGPYQLRAPFTQQDILIALKAAQHRAEQIASIDQAIEDGSLPIPVRWTATDRFSHWISRHYLAVFNIFVLIYVGLPFLAPVLMKVGASGPAGLIYRGYNAVCHELAFRSWFLFGDQAAYPRRAAGVEDLISYEDAIGLDATDLWAARSYVGDDRIGFKVALCQRDVAIYSGILLFGILFALTARKIGPLHWLFWLLVGILPVGIDGVSQLLSQPPLNLFPYRESTPVLRSITGGLFGFMTAWFGYPLVEASMKETEQYINLKFQRFKQYQKHVDQDGIIKGITIDSESSKR